tara:strand:- start:138 stop:656 length:519 start_codon:yes stop_codon:yes gene_type:complete
LKIIETKIPEVFLIETNVYKDSRGFFTETYNLDTYSTNKFVNKFVQDNLVYSKKNVLRGLHYQINKPQGKLVQCIQGLIFDVAVDIRKNSARYLSWVGYELSSMNNRQLYIPEGFAHGYCVLSDDALVSYKCTNTYNPIFEKGVKWDDPMINIDWPIKNPILSNKDKQLSYI